MTTPAITIRSRMALGAAIRAAGVTKDSADNLFSEGEGSNGTYLMHFTSPDGTVTYKVPVTPADPDSLRAQAQAIAAAWDWSDAAQLARETTTRRADAKALLANLDAFGDLIRAVAGVIMDGFTAQDNAVAAATSLGDLKTRWAALASTHTLAQAKTAINNKLDSGAADS